MCISIARQWVAKHILVAEYTGNNRRIPVSMQWQRKHTSITIEELLGNGVLNVFSVPGPCQRFIGNNEGHLQSAVEQEAE
jgi:hypothetical protein